MRWLMLMIVLAAVTSSRAQDLGWIDASEMTVEGRGWTDTEALWDRLPSRARKLVRQPVWNLSRHTAGMAVRFVTDAPTIHARWTLASRQLAMPHMPATGVSGIDLYVRTQAGWRWVTTPRPTKQTMSARLVTGLAQERREWLLYLPLYNGVSKLELGVPAPHVLKPGAVSKRKPIVFYGTSITQGGCASRPGMCHPAILGRRLDRPVINLGFSGNGKMETALADLLAELDASLYVIDCLPNMNGKMVTERTVPFVRRLRKTRPRTPILLVEDRTYQDAHLNTGRARANAANRKALRAAFEALKAEKVRKLHYLEGADLLGPDGEGTVDGSHPTDLGFLRQADVMEPVLRKILRQRR